MIRMEPCVGRNESDTVLSHNEFESCLAYKHVVLIGDSRVRYQYMALAYFLKTGKMDAMCGLSPGKSEGDCRQRRRVLLD